MEFLTHFYQHIEKLLEKPNLPNSSIFEIKDSSVNIQEIMDEIESSLKARNISKAEIDRISKFSFAPKSPAGFREFDPSYTAHLFEKGISAPKFTNPSLWFVKGPIKWIVVKLVEIYSFVDKKLSENRIRAFYNLIHELIYLRLQNEALTNRYEKFYKDFLELKALVQDKVQPDFEISLVQSLNSGFRQIDDKILEDLSKNSKNVLILYPDWGEFLLKLRTKKIDFRAVSFSKNQFDHIKKEITDNILFSDLDCAEFSGFDSIVIACNANLIANWKIELLLKNLSERGDKNAKIYLRFNEKEISSNAPFQPAYPTKIDRANLSPYLRNTGYKDVTEWESEDGEYCIFTFCVA